MELNNAAFGKDKCPVNVRKNKASLRYTPVKKHLDERYVDSEKMKVCRNRNGMEATNSTKKKNGLGQLRVKGLKKVLFKALALNVRQITAYLFMKSREQRVKSAKKARKK